MTDKLTDTREGVDDANLLEAARKRERETFHAIREEYGRNLTRGHSADYMTWLKARSELSALEFVHACI